MADQFSLEDARSMVEIYTWLDAKKFARSVPKNSKPLRIIHRPKGDAKADSNVIYVKDFSSNQQTYQMETANSALLNAGLRVPPVALRDRIIPLYFSSDHKSIYHHLADRLVRLCYLEN